VAKWSARGLLSGPIENRSSPWSFHNEVTGPGGVSPLRNVTLQAAFFHNGAFTRLEDAIRHHLDVFSSARHYNPAAADVDSDLMAPMGPTEPVLARVDPIFLTPIQLTDDEFQQLVDFVRNGLLDRRATPEYLKKQIPKSVPSGFPVLKFQ